MHPFLFKNVAGISSENWHRALVLSVSTRGTKSGKGALCLWEVVESPLLNSVTLDESFRLTAGGSCICKTELRQPAPPSSQSSSEDPVCISVLCRLYGVIIIASVRYISRRYLENWCERAASFLFLAHLPPPPGAVGVASLTAPPPAGVSIEICNCFVASLRPEAIGTPCELPFCLFLK